MRKRTGKIKEDAATYYSTHGILQEIEDGPVEFALEEELRQQIIRGERKRRLENISIKLDPAQIQALKKVAAMKSTPYQSLIRQWLAERISRELQLTRLPRR